jgi:hypothetical protein
MASSPPKGGGFTALLAVGKPAPAVQGDHGTEEVSPGSEDEAGVQAAAEMQIARPSAIEDYDAGAE